MEIFPNDDATSEMMGTTRQHSEGEGEVQSSASGQRSTVA